ncbi:general transcription factor 3C polypeptide 1 [Biomphalaria pfeifferi]|uniref:General transcription factor 3C polypeptide 1 n=1 Tax=Biomphalaria pfeifferi TaxID=112525 RepID=A0AAD8FID3_BIOPF|nr:general transcription factor 3C polypeptide 1 [Biomphalaria pfeifferi]
MDFTAVTEEIALEGLEGITLSALWLRLEHRSNFPKENLDEDSKKYIWQYLTGCMELEFYNLPEPRTKLKIFKYSDYVLTDYNCCLPPDTPPDIYNYVPIESMGIKGSCEHFITRTHVTTLVRDENGKSLLLLEEVSERWGESFVIVASQHLRNLTLFGHSFIPSGLSLDVYCTLECIGRGRTEGEITACKYDRGLSRMKTKNCPKTTLFSSIKLLVYFGLVVKQPYTLRYQAIDGISQVRLVHLRRFFPNVNRSLIKDTSDYLMTQPEQRAVHRVLLNDLGLSATHLKKLKRKYPGHIESDLYLYRELHPNSSESEWKTKSGEERRVRMVKLLKPYIQGEDEGSQIIDSSDDSEDEDSSFIKNDLDVDEEEDDEEIEEEKMDESEKEKMEEKETEKVFGHPVYQRPLLNQIIMLVSQSGARGMMVSEVRSQLNISLLRMRYSMKLLKKSNMLSTVVRSRGKNNVTFLLIPKVAEELKSTKQERNLKEMVIDYEGIEMDMINTETNCTPETLQDLDKKIEELNIVMLLDRDTRKKDKRPKKENERKNWRKLFLTKFISETKAIHASHILYTALCKHEAKMGSKETMCRKSFRNILFELQEEKKLYIIGIASKEKPDKMLQQMIIDYSIPPDSVVVKRTLLLSPLNVSTVKFKSAAPSSPYNIGKNKAGHKKPEVPSPIKQNTAPDSGLAMVSICDLLENYSQSGTTPTSPEVQENPPKNYRSFSTMAKYEKAEFLHKYLFYLLYQYEGNVDGLPEGSTDDDSPPFVYLDVDDWRRYLPPLKKHNVAILRDLCYPGTCMMGDFILNMPLELFCQMARGAMEVPGLQELLDDPVKKLYPLRLTPPSVLFYLLYKRKYRAKIRDNLIRLCHMGLLSFGPVTSNKELEFITIFLHSKAMLLDTRKSLRCYLMTRCPEGETFDILNFHFLNMEEVERYWQDLRRICLFSQMGSSSIEDIKGNHGTVTILEAHAPKPFDQMVQENWLPGDRRGAAGLDSSLYGHRSNNWNIEGLKRNLGMSLMVQPLISTDKVELKVDSDLGEPSLVTENENTASPAKAHKACRLQKQQMPSSPTDMDVDGIPSTKAKKLPTKRKALPAAKSIAKKAKREYEKLSKRAVKKRKLIPKLTKAKKRKNRIFDNTDKAALQRLKKMRASFTPMENGMILLFEVTSCLLFPRAPQCVQTTFLRDILHQLLEESRDKTANAIKGKAARLMKDKRFRCYLSNYISQALSDEKISNKIKNLKRPQIFSEEMQGHFKEVFFLLKDKFGSLSTHQIYLPSSLSELRDDFILNTTDYYLYSTPKMEDSRLTLTSIKTIVVWDLLECFLHLKTPILSTNVFFTLSKYSDEVIHNAYNLLRTHGIIIKLKRAEKDRRIIVTNSSALLNSHKSMLRHTEALKSLIPPELFKNTVSLMNHLRSVSLKKCSNVSGDALSNGASGDACPSKEVPNNGEGLINPVTTKVEHIFVDIDLHNYHGGVVMCLLTLMTKKQGKIKVHIPDEMVKLDEEGQQKLFYKQPQTKLAREKKLAALMESDEDSMDEWPSEEGSSIYKEQRTGKKLDTVVKKSQNPSTFSLGTDEVKSDQDDLSSELKTIRLESVTMTLKDVKISASSVLSNFNVWVGSGSLLTLARTSIIEKLDLLMSRCLLQRNFIVEPASIQLALTSSGDEVKSVKRPHDHLLDPNDTETVHAREEGQHFGVFDILDYGLYKHVISHLEKCFSCEFDQDDMEAILKEKLPSENHQKATTLLKYIDRADKIGISEEELEVNMASSSMKFKDLMHQLIFADLVSTNQSLSHSSPVLHVI